MDIREFSTLKSLMSVQIFGSRLFNVLQVVKELGRHLKRKSKESGNESGGTVFWGVFFSSSDSPYAQPDLFGSFMLVEGIGSPADPSVCSFQWLLQRSICLS